MVAVLTSLRAPSGVVGDVYQPNNGTLYRIVRVFNSSSGLYDWQAERNPGLLTSNWDRSITGYTAHNFTSGHVGYPLVNISGGVYHYNNDDDFHMYKVCGMVGEIWNTTQFSMIPTAAPFTISLDLLNRPSSSGVGPKYYYWNRSINKYTYTNPSPSSYYPIQDILEVLSISVPDNTAQVKIRTPVGSTKYDYRPPLFKHIQASPSTTWSITHPYHRYPQNVFVMVSGTPYRDFSVASSSGFLTTLTLSGSFAGNATLEFFPFNVQPTGYDGANQGLYPYISELDRFFNL